MAHASCPNGHGMWNGDGKPVVWAYRVGFFRDFMKTHPDCRLDEESEYSQLYDCVDDVPGEDLDCWYCDECKGLVVYVDIARYDFKRMENLPDVKPENLDGWEDYIALRDREFEDFQDFYEGKNPIEAIEQYDFTYHYKLSPDKKMIYALDKEGKIVFGYFRSNYTEFSPETEIRFGEGEDSVPYRPYEWAKGKMDICVHPGKYVYTKDGRTIYIDSVIEDGKRYKGRDINRKELPEVEIEYSDVRSVVDEICKAVTVE